MQAQERAKLEPQLLTVIFKHIELHYVSSSSTPLPYPSGGASIPSRKATYGSSGTSDHGSVSVAVSESANKAAADAALGSFAKVGSTVEIACDRRLLCVSLQPRSTD